MRFDFLCTLLTRPAPLISPPLLAGQPHTPDVFPTVNLLPTFNTMAAFTVQPGQSFHAVQVCWWLEEQGW